MACPFQVPVCNGPVAWVLMVVAGGSVVGVIVLGVAVVTASALRQPVHSHAGTRKPTCHFSFTAKCLCCYTFQVARLGWLASTMHLSNQSGRSYSTVRCSHGICQGENNCQGAGNIMVKPPLLPGIQGEI